MPQCTTPDRPKTLLTTRQQAGAAQRQGRHWKVGEVHRAEARHERPSDQEEHQGQEKQQVPRYNQQKELQDPRQGGTHLRVLWAEHAQAVQQGCRIGTETPTSTCWQTWYTTWIDMKRQQGLEWTDIHNTLIVNKPHDCTQIAIINVEKSCIQSKKIVILHHESDGYWLMDFGRSRGITRKR